jgi:hypothetical protein
LTKKWINCKQIANILNINVLTIVENPNRIQDAQIPDISPI